MRHLVLLFLAISLVGCSVLLKDEKDIDKVLEDVVHEEFIQIN